MSFFKNLTSKLIIIIIIFLLAIAAAAFLVHSFLMSNIKAQYFEAGYFKLDALANSFVYDINQKYLMLNDDVFENSTDFYAVGQLQGASLTGYREENSQTFLVNSQIAQNLNNDINYFSFKEMLAGQTNSGQLTEDETRLVIISKTLGERVIIGFIKASDLLNNDIGFFTYGLFFDSQKIAVSNNNSHIGVRYSDLFGELSYQEIKSTTHAQKAAYAFAKTYTLTLTQEISFTCYGLTESSLANDFSDKLLINEVIAFSIVILLCFVFVVISTIISVREYKSFCGIDGRRLFVVKTDKEFNIIKANRAFKKIFPNTKSLRSVLANPLKTNANMFFFEAVDSKNNVNYLTMLLNRGLTTFTFVGAENTAMMQTVKEGYEKIMYDDSTRLPNERSLISDMDNMESDFLLGKIKPQNLDSFKVMFGNEFEAKLKLFFAKRFNEVFKRFGSIYYLAEKDIFVFLCQVSFYPDIIKQLPHLMQQLNKPMSIMQNLVKVDCKGGFVLCDHLMQDKTVKNVLYYCQVALEKATDNKNVNHYVYHESQRKFYLSYLRKDIDILKLIENNEILVYYQPQYSVTKNCIVGVEALMRIKTAENISLSVSEIVNIAEKSGCMIALSDYIYEQGFQTAKLLEPYKIAISLNVSPVQLMQAGFAEAFLAKYSKFGLKPNSLCLEITESFLMSNFEETIKKLQILQAKGISIHLDDFGMAYSSLMYLKKLPISTIKIDKEFISDISDNEYSRTIVKIIADICKNLSLTCIAEGVETKEQKNYLTKAGVDIIQGFFISKAVSKDALLALVSSYKEQKND